MVQQDPLEYPSEILPQPEFKIIDCDLSDQHLIRSTSTKEKEELVDRNTGLVKTEHICSPRTNMEDLSTSLFGVFNQYHNAIELTKEGKNLYSEYCPPNIEVVPPVHNEHYPSSQFIIQPLRTNFLMRR